MCIEITMIITYHIFSLFMYLDSEGDNSVIFSFYKRNILFCFGSIYIMFNSLKQINVFSLFTFVKKYSDGRKQRRPRPA